MTLRLSKWADQPPQTLEFSGAITLAVDDGGKLSGSAFKGLEALMTNAVWAEMSLMPATPRGGRSRSEGSRGPALQAGSERGQSWTIEYSSMWVTNP